LINPSNVGPAFLQLVSELETSLGRFREALAAEYGVDPIDSTPVGLGERQEAIARLSELFSDTGLTAGEISTKVKYDESNTYNVLSSLEKAGILELVRNSSPRRWRLADRHRRDRILLASHVIKDGEWTTYGDVAVAATGNKNAARAVGRIAAKHPSFANPHRVIQVGGLIPPGWRGFGGGPEECERRLKAEKVKFIDGKANPGQRITWEEIETRLKAHEASQSAVNC
jgi:alkylated DNA nucleotide flippase Atl1